MKKILTITVFYLLSFACFPEDIIISLPNNNKIRDYVSCKTEITSIRFEKTIIPSYKFTLKKERDNKIKELSIEMIYYYGQTFSFTNRKLFILSELEINTLNEKGEIIISNTLPEIGRESLMVLENQFRYVEPDGEAIDDIFCKLTVEGRSVN